MNGFLEAPSFCLLLGSYWNILGERKKNQSSWEKKKKEKANFKKRHGNPIKLWFLKADLASCSDQKPILEAVNKKLEVLSSTPYTSIDIISFYWNF